MGKFDDIPQVDVRGSRPYQSQAPAREIEANILSARTAGRSTPILKIPITLDDCRPGHLTMEVLDERPVITDAGTIYKCLLAQYSDGVGREVTLLIPDPARDKRALVTLSY
jgi:hypothetical protein